MLFATAVVVGCQSVATDVDRPARIVNPDASSRAVLQGAVDKILRTQVLLSESALTDTSLLIIENWPTPKMGNPVPQGRMIEPPRQFRLVINGNDCLLIDLRDQSRHPLANTKCIAE